MRDHTHGHIKESTYITPQCYVAEPVGEKSSKKSGVSFEDEC